MILEFITFVMFALVLGIKYGAVTRIVRLKQRLREVENNCRRQKENLRMCQNERLIAEREQTTITRQRRILQDELQRLNNELDIVKDESRQVIEELMRRNTRIDPSLITGNEVVPDDQEQA